ncbi:hypothetical protein ASU31_25155 [Pedobacter ginsenosidimutans]|uniref:GmrSD restriction endonucleases N-terminal domain-containing protein n=1 Tax=Pedobacter ginsenosidimutans TaxID=687842 RepID=A0A0T5VHH8_9SPHI|nr:DUF262 domain-containing protein [Pedobacter ginsenosidimutans]KRT13303.1 hypothetical protein ASU31_25155 [Pedobacter ginsenosidimutans]
MSNLQINTRVRRLFQYLDDFEKGRIQVPPFQRDFVWDNQKKLDLLDSLKKGFPIGSVLFWQADEENLFLEEDVQKIGSYSLPRNGNDFYFILDGYQRLSTLFGCFIDHNRTSLSRDEIDWKKNFDIVYNLQEDRFEFNRRTTSEIQIFQIPLYHFIDGEKFYDFQTDLVHSNVDENKKKEYIRLYKSFGAKISGYDIPSIDLVGGNIKEAVEIFSRLNSRGERITDDWKVSALSFSPERKFRFGSEIDHLFDRLERYDFFNSNGERKHKRDLILKCVVNSFGKVYFDVSNVSNELEELAQRRDFIDISMAAFVSIEKAVKFLYEELMVLSSNLLPYNSHLIFITEFFNRLPDPSRSQLDKLKKWFWQTTYANYFTVYNLAKQRLAYYRFVDFLGNEEIDPFYLDKRKKFETVEFPKKISMKSVRAKALALFMLNYSVKYLEILGPMLISVKGRLNYKDMKIFKNIDNPDGDNISENTIMVITPDPESFFYERQGMLLSAGMFNEDNLSRYFLFKEMLNNLSEKEFLEMRLSIVKDQEKNFVEQLNVVYSS